jgi:hypothetical protein
MDPLIKYQENLNKYYTSIVNLKYIFEVEKCCGYSEFVSVYKTNTMANLYIETRNQFDNQTITELYVFNSETNQGLYLPNDESILVRDFISQNSSFFKPTYPLPASVIYKIKFDDGHVH